MLAPYLKALYGAATAAVAAALAYFQGGGHSPLIGALIAAAAGLSAGGVVWGIPNASPNRAKDAGKP